jgi:poly(A) polymerase/tRNA nucleotidyltransferase (CCA-adding enzyme)
MTDMKESQKIPIPVLETLSALERAGFEAFVVGGCVRDLMLGREPKDWDITTNARPEEIQKVFPESFYENIFGTVGIKVAPFMLKEKEDREEDVIEITTYRAESGYDDNRHPSKVSFVQTIEEDLARRDFTMNAIALRVSNFQFPISNKNTVLESTLENCELNIENSFTDYQLIDPFNGQRDIKDKVIRAVGDPNARFGEDALRMLRAVRFSAELRTPTSLSKEAFMQKDNASEALHEHSDWKIEPETFSAIQKHASDIRMISAERVSDELSKILLSNSPAHGIDMLRGVGLLAHILPELEAGVGVGQNLHHIYTVYEHNIRALATCPSKRLEVRLAALLHDVGKPQTKRSEGLRSTFYNHDHVGARIAKKLLERLRFPTKVVEKVTLLVDNHLFYYNVGEVTAASVRRLVKRVGLENMRDLMDIRIGDRLGSGTPKAKPYKLRHLEYMIEKVSRDPISVKMLAINGSDLMQELTMTPGPKIGAILDVLLAEVIEDPKKNTREHLLVRAKTLETEDLDRLRELAKDKIEEKRASDDQKVKHKHWVQ